MSVISDSGTRTTALESRWLWLFLPTVFTLLPFTVPIREGGLAGAGPDVVSSIWAMWWYQQADWASVIGGDSTLFNFPWGGAGIILSPICAQIWSLLDYIIGSIWATIGVDWLLLNSMMWATIWLGHILGCSRLVCGTMAMCWLLPRYVVFTLGETGVVGVAVLPLILGLGAWWKVQQRNDLRWQIMLVFCIGLQALENPYLAPALPFLVSLDAIYHRRWRSFWLVGAGVLLMGAVVFLFRAGSGDYESVKPSGYTQLFGLYFPAVERVWARTTLFELLTPNTVLWPAGSMDSIHIQGRAFIGYTSALLLALGLWCRDTRLWAAFALAGLVLVTGSDWGGYPSPFGLLNSLANVLVRPFTQPSRYFVLFVLGLSIVVGLLLKTHTAWRYPCMILITVESLFLGGASLQIPSTPMMSTECTTFSQLDGPVLIWPWDGADDQWYESSIQSRLFQIQHDQPAATIATGSWYLTGDVFPGKRLRDLGWRKAVDMKGALDVQALHRLGYQYVVIDKSAGRVLSRHARDNVFHHLDLVEDCDELIVMKF